MRGNRFDFRSLDIAVHTPTYAMMISVIEGSSMLGVVPKRVGEKFAEKYGLKLLVHPDPPEDIRHLIQWHRHRIADTGVNRSEERRVGKECVRTSRSRWSTYHLKKNIYQKA